MKTFVYFYLNYGAPAEIGASVPLHVAYWRVAAVANYRGGPFADRSGGLILFAAADLQKATDIMLQDPFVLRGLVGEKWLKEWTPE